MAAFRFLAAVFALIAVVALVDDAAPAIYGTSPLELKSLESQWDDMAPASLAAARSAISNATAPWLWEALRSLILAWPASAVFGVLALLSGYAGRRRRRVEIFVN
jgi:hypothetical protein